MHEAKIAFAEKAAQKANSYHFGWLIGSTGYIRGLSNRVIGPLFPGKTIKIPNGKIDFWCQPVTVGTTPATEIFVSAGEVNSNGIILPKGMMYDHLVGGIHDGIIEFRRLRFA